MSCVVSSVALANQMAVAATAPAAGPLCNAIERLHNDNINIYSVTNLSLTSPTVLTNLVTCTLRGIIHLNDEIILICKGLKIFLFCLSG